MRDSLLVARHLTKRYGERFAVSDLSFEVRAGDVYGLLGPNGAGKSTLLRMLMGLIRPTSGTIEFDGEPMTARSRQRIGGAIEYPSFYGYLSARENLRMLAALSGAKLSDRDLAAALDRVGLSARADEPASRFSQGMKQRLAIALALVSRPALMLLDEPTNGLDPHGIRDLRELIVTLARRDGITILISSHLLAEVGLICNRALVVNRGLTVWEGEVKNLMQQQAGIELRSSSPEAGARLRELGYVAEERDGSYWVKHVDDAAALTAALVARNVRVEALIPSAPTLETLFFSLLGQEVRPS